MTRSDVGVIPAPNADLYARAVIAAALVYGDDPVAAMLGGGYGARRCLPAAASGLARALRLQLKVVTGPLGLNSESCRTHRVKRRAPFDKAEASVIEAVKYALWRPEAAAPPVVAAPLPELRRDDEEGADVAAPPVQRFAEPELDEAPPPLSGTRATHVVYDEIAAAEPPKPSEHRKVVGAALLARREAAARGEDRPAVGPVLVAPPPERARLAASPGPVESSLAERIVALLADGPLTSMSIATRLDAKEMHVTSTLTQMEAAGQLVSMPAPANLARRFIWAVKSLEVTAHG